MLEGLVLENHCWNAYCEGHAAQKNMHYTKASLQLLE